MAKKMVKKTVHVAGPKTASKLQRQHFLRPVKLAMFTVMLVQSPFGSAAEWRIVPTATLRETYSDNANNATRGNEQSDFITDISPGVQITGTGRRLRLNADYSMHNLLYANGTQGSSIVNQLNANGFAELVDDLVFLDASASVSRQSISAFGPQSDNLYSNTNATNVRTVSLSPFTRYRFGNQATSEVRFAHTATSTGQAGLSNSQTDSLSATLDSGTAFNTVGWGVHANKSNTHYTETQSQQSQNEGANLRYRLNNQLSLTATGGYESYSYAVTDGEKPEGKYWSTGFIWAPTERTHVDASFGRRYYGNSYALNASNRSRYVTTTLVYSEDITTSQEQFAQQTSTSTATLFDTLFQASVPDATLRSQAVAAFIRNNGLPESFASSVNSLTNRIFLQKRAQLSTAFTASKTTVVASAYTTTREAQSGAQADASLLSANSFALDADNRVTGVSLFGTVRVSPVSTANLGTSLARTTSLNSDRRDTNKNVTLGLSTQFQPKLRGTVELRRNQTDSNLTGGSTRENAISAYLSMQL
ncbi:MAG: TIGR03016 family PEP-CTERM system-associated outer membrane protein [Janthinobacterium lividum]